MSGNWSGRCPQLYFSILGFHSVWPESYRSLPPLKITQLPRFEFVVVSPHGWQLVEVAVLPIDRLSGPAILDENDTNTGDFDRQPRIFSDCWTIMHYVNDIGTSPKDSKDLVTALLKTKKAPAKQVPFLIFRLVGARRFELPTPWTPFCTGWHAFSNITIWKNDTFRLPPDWIRGCACCVRCAWYQ